MSNLVKIYSKNKKVVPGGFEPPQFPSKGNVLPLDERTI